MSRFSAFAIHLGLSFLIFIGLAYLVVFQWYPDFFFETDGGWRGMRIIVFVDLVLGPALTLVVYKHGKPGLRTDLALIGLVQISCLIAGTWVVYSERPLAIVYNDSRFSVMSADDYKEAGVPIPDLSEYPGNGPKWVMIEIPTGLHEEADFRGKYFSQGRALNTFEELYKPFDFSHQQVLGDALSKEQVESTEPRKVAVSDWLQEHGGSTDDYLFYGFASRFSYGFLIMRPDSGQNLGVLNLSDV